MDQLELFGQNVIMNISFDETTIIKNILKLHCDGDVELDPTYSVGNFYKKLKQPKYKFDLKPQIDGVVQADSRYLPVKSESIKTIMFDPPFLIGSSKYNETKYGSCIIGKRFSQFRNYFELEDLYRKSLSEFYRILINHGIVIFKCQDTIVGRKQFFIHIDIYKWAMNTGFYALDLFIYLTKNRMVDNRIQKHARKFNSYFWVFKKTKRKDNF